MLAGESAVTTVAGGDRREDDRAQLAVSKVVRDWGCRHDWLAACSTEPVVESRAFPIIVHCGCAVWERPGLHECGDGAKAKAT